VGFGELVGAAGSNGWRYGWVMSVMVRGGGPSVTISVPEGWRSSVALGAENAVFDVLHLPSCPPAGVWNSFGLLFYLRSPAACVPLQVQVGQQVGLIRVDLGRSCPGWAGTVVGSGMVGHPG
jgi:hypothetical protein